MLDTHRDTLKRLVAAYQREQYVNVAPDAALQPAAGSYRALFVEPLLAMLGWLLPRGQDSQGESAALTPAPWPAQSGLPPAYLCTHAGTRRFMLASVAPGVDIDRDAGPAQRLRRRAWSAGLPLAVLTNVETIILYDTRMRPGARDDVGVSLRLRVTWDEVVQRWGALDAVLSKQAMLCGGFDAFAYAPGKRAVGAKQALLADVERWRSMLGVPPAEARAVVDGLLFVAMAKARTGWVRAPLQDARPSAPGGGDIRTDMMRALGEAAQLLPPAALECARAHIMHVDGPGLRAVAGELFDTPAYDLAWLPDDVLGHIYEASRLAGRKSSGVYYTPAPVVQHVVRHVMRRIAADTRAARPALLATELDVQPQRILDPACGAGAFLVEVYHALLDATLVRYLKTDPMENPRLSRMPGGAWRLTLAERCRLLTTHIFGVDIDPQAVAVTKRALLLAALATESPNPSDAPSGAMGTARGLPDLDANILCGNMLIAPDFGASDVPGFDWQARFPAAAAAGGFDAVVGNPPYGLAFSDAEKAYLKKRFIHQGDRPDSYLLFVELALRELTRPFGYCGMVIPNPWLTNVKQGPLRRFVLQNARLEQIVHLGCAMFKSKAVVDTQIVLLRRHPPQGNDVHTHLVRACEPSGALDLASATTLVHEQASWMAQDDAPINIFVDEPRRALAAKIRAAGPAVTTRLAVSVGMKPYQVGKGRPKQTAGMVQSRIYDADTAKGPDYRRYLRGADIRRFIVAPVRARYVRYGPWLAEPRVAANFDAPAKLLLRQTGDRLVAAIDDARHVCMNNLHVLTPLDAGAPLDAYAGLFNSRLMNWYYQVLNPERGEALAEVKKYHVANLPVPEGLIGASRVAACAAAMTALARDASAADATEAARASARASYARAQAQLDAQVYALFALSADEIAIIEQDPVD